MRVRTLTDDQRERARRSALTIRAAWTDYFRDHDFLLLPGSPFPALTKAGCTAENRSRILALTAPASIGGLPVLSVPVSLHAGLTTGLQIIVPEPHSPAIRWALDQAAAI
jgi:amidase/aspartyl-tRNA(Asn)/glutamyl-tRNA(Gln) amidotransferase subunit A